MLLDHLCSAPGISKPMAAAFKRDDDCWAVAAQAHCLGVCRLFELYRSAMIACQRLMADRHGSRCQHSAWQYFLIRWQGNQSCRKAALASAAACLAQAHCGNNLDAVQPFACGSIGGLRLERCVGAVSFWRDELATSSLQRCRLQA